MGRGRGVVLGAHGAGVAAAWARGVDVDLPSYDPSAQLEDYADLALAPLPDGAEHLVVVGHSLGGMVAPLIAEQQRAADRVPVRLRARSSAELEPKRRREPFNFLTGWDDLAGRQIVRADGSTSWPADAAIEAMYHDCALDQALAASQRLRPQHWGPTRQTSPLSSWPETHYTWVVCVGDRIVSPTWQRASARERGGTVVELSGGHAPMLSRPHTLGDVLTRLVPAR